MLLAVSAAIGLAFQAGCAEQSPPRRPLSAEDWQKVQADSALLIADIRWFRQTHDYKNLTVQDALARLSSEGFACELSFVDTREAVPGQLLVFRSVHLPYLHCMRQEPPSDDLCKARQVTLDVNWQDRAAPPDQLARQYTLSTIQNHGYRCVTEAQR